jgi:hypothetical protein
MKEQREDGICEQLRGRVTSQVGVYAVGVRDM